MATPNNNQPVSFHFIFSLYPIGSIICQFLLNDNPKNLQTLIQVNSSFYETILTEYSGTCPHEYGTIDLIFWSRARCGMKFGNAPPLQHKRTLSILDSIKGSRSQRLYAGSRNLRIICAHEPDHSTPDHKVYLLDFTDRCTRIFQYFQEAPLQSVTFSFPRQIIPIRSVIGGLPGFEHLDTCNLRRLEVKLPGTVGSDHLDCLTGDLATLLNKTKTLEELTIQAPLVLKTLWNSIDSMSIKKFTIEEILDMDHTRHRIAPCLKCSSHTHLCLPSDFFQKLPRLAELYFKTSRPGNNTDIWKDEVSIRALTVSHVTGKLLRAIENQKLRNLESFAWLSWLGFSSKDYSLDRNEKLANEFLQITLPKSKIRELKLKLTYNTNKDRTKPVINCLDIFDLHHQNPKMLQNITEFHGYLKSHVPVKDVLDLIIRLGQEGSLRKINLELFKPIRCNYRSYQYAWMTEIRHQIEQWQPGNPGVLPVRCQFNRHELTDQSLPNPKRHLSVGWIDCSISGGGTCIRRWAEEEYLWQFEVQRWTKVNSNGYNREVVSDCFGRDLEQGPVGIY